MERIIELPCTLDGSTRRKDRSVALRFSTMFEVSNEDFSTIDTYHQQAGYLLFKSNKFETDEIPTTEAPTDLKSPSERLRSILYVYHMQKDGDPAKFRAFYEATVEKYIQKVKDSIE